MRKILLLTAFLFISFFSLGQCPTSQLTLTTQAEVDAFSANYPGCTILNQDLRIESETITSLAGLSQLNEVNAKLGIWNSTGLNDLIGLQNITFIEDLEIVNCNGITSLNGLQGLTQLTTLWISGAALSNMTGMDNVHTISKSLRIENCNYLQTLGGLQNITMDDPDATLRIYRNFDLTTLGSLIQNVAGRVDLNISLNLDLENLQGLEVITHVKNLEIHNLLDITDLNGLQNITTVDGSVRITNNSQLMNVQPLQGLTMTGIDATSFNRIGANTSMTTFEGLFAENTVLHVGFSFALNNNMQNLDGLLSVVGIDGSLYLSGSSSAPIANLDGVQNIIGELQGLTIVNFDHISNVDPFSGITAVKEAIGIIDNPNLTNLDGLSNIEFIPSVPAGNQKIILIERNDILTDISGLGDLDAVLYNDNFNLSIEDNPQLSICDYDAICELLANQGNAQITIINNAPGCANEVEVADACGLLINSIQGDIKFDFNADGCDPGDSAATSLQIEITDGIDTFTVLSDNQGTYAKALLTDGSFTTSIVPESLPTYFVPSPISQDSNFIGFGNEDIINFCLTATESINDLKISLLPTSPAVPGFDSTYDLVYENVGTTQLSGQVTLLFDESRQVFVGAIPSETTLTGGLIAWDYIDLNPFESRIIKVTLNNLPPPANEIGDEIPLRAQVFPIADDANPGNNTSEIKQIVVGAFDPNDKNVVQGSEIPEAAVGKYLNYVVRFQNTGNADAINVVIEDELDSNLQWGTLRPLSSSHDYRVEIRDGNQVSFIFENINLPPEISDPEGSQGYIAFQVRTQETLVVGDAVENTAAIFFDFNPPIITNTVTTTVVDIEPPTAVCQSINVFLDNNGQVTILATDIDNGSSDTNGIASLELDTNTFDCSHVGENTVTLTVTDTFGNVSECIAIVTVIDDLAPLLACQSIVVSLDENGTASIEAISLLDMTNTMDNCGIESIGSSITMVDCDAIVTPLEVTVFVEDVNGNIAICETTISAIDELPPVFDTSTLPNDQTKLTDETGIYLLEDFTTGVMAEDNCSTAVTLTQTPAVDDPLTPGVYDVVITATDTFSNETEYTFELTVELLLGVDPFSIENKITIYPNPVSDVFQIKASGGLQLKNVTIFSVQGEQLLVSSEEKINLSLLAEGVYFALIATDQGAVTKKIIKN